MCLLPACGRLPVTAWFVHEATNFGTEAEFIPHFFTKISFLCLTATYTNYVILIVYKIAPCKRINFAKLGKS